MKPTPCPFCAESFDGLPALAYHLSRGCTPMTVSRDHYVEMIEKRQREDRLMREDRAIYEARHK